MEGDDPFAVIIPAKEGSSTVNNHQPEQYQQQPEYHHQQQRQLQPLQQEKEIREGEGSFPSLDDHEDQDYVHISKPSLSDPTNNEGSLSAAAAAAVSPSPQGVAQATAPVPAALVSTSATANTSFSPGGSHSMLLSHHHTITPAVDINIAGFSVDQERRYAIYPLSYLSHIYILLSNLS